MEERNRYIKFVCIKCVAGDMHRRKQHDRKLGRNRYAYVCNKCGCLRYFDIDGLIGGEESQTKEKRTMKNRIDDMKKTVKGFRKKGGANVSDKETNTNNTKK